MRVRSRNVLKICRGLNSASLWGAMAGSYRRLTRCRGSPNAGEFSGTLGDLSSPSHGNRSVVELSCGLHPPASACPFHAIYLDRGPERSPVQLCPWLTPDLH